ncbi:MAG: diguanylate cyclase, partial [Gammaproteobacteria bacterium]|nr:diguanylate cyclase [Gammaproteobacteria bacterium]
MIPEKIEKLLKQLTFFFFVSAITIIIVIAVASFVQFKKLLRAGDWVEHSYQVIIFSQGILANITYIESMQRGYLLFQSQDYRAEYNKTENILKSSLAILPNMVSDNPTQYRRAIDINFLVQKKLKLIDTINASNIPNKVHAVALADLFLESKSTSFQLRRAINQFIEEENLLLKSRNETLTNGTKINILLISCGQLISLIFLASAFILLYRSRKEINSKEKQLRGIINGAKDIIVVVDPKMRLLIFNEAFKNEFMTLFNKEVKVGMSFPEALNDVAAEYKEAILNLWKESLEAPIPYSKYFEINVNNTVFSYEINSSKLYDGTKLLGAVQITRNVTERTKEQEELKKSHIKLQKTMEELKNKNEKITILLEMSDVVLAVSSLSELSVITAKYAMQILDFSNGYTYIMHPSRNLLETDSRWGKPKSVTKQFTPDDCWALRLGKIHQYIKSTDLVCAHATEDIYYMCVPLRAQNDIFGLLYIELDETFAGKLEINDKLMVGAFAEVTALALANVTLRENLRFQSIRDPLTTLYNRRYLEEFFFKMIAQAERNHQPISILMLDLDHFKRINDVHGHEAGDLILKQFSQIMLNNIRPGDIAARYGGEEFIVLLYNTDLEIASNRANLIRSNVASVSVKYGADFLGNITVSIGIASFPRDGKDS